MGKGTIFCRMIFGQVGKTIAAEGRRQNDCRIILEGGWTKLLAEQYLRKGEQIIGRIILEGRWTELL